MSMKNIVVAGGGVLGSQIAFQTAFKGFNVTIWLRSEGSIGRAKPKLERVKNIYLTTLEQMKTDPSAYCNGFTDKKDLTDDEIDELKNKAELAYDNITLTTSYAEAGNDADLIIEAIAEDPKQKIPFYQELAKNIPDKTIIVTNSSTLLPSAFAEYTGRPEKYLALHFANSIWKNNTAEVMGHAGTDQKYYDIVVDFAEKIGMVPLQLKKEQPGYILNSMLVPFLNAAEMLYAKGVADPETIDKTWVLATGAPIGPFRILDIVGLTTAYNIVIMNPNASDIETIEGKIAAMLKEKIDAGKTGINAGEGFYKY
ncbi:MAG: 3-hydroxyacyl-CoA dehydrogenase [Methanobacteriaceae archaeon]|jgi:3-hydroxyacyl-CoA dehydrogenase|uniref:3-hydroxyacyl-CoA dehydrogenase n=1 Tax=Methanobrevibacter TaxID=2172 RepID=UPI002A0AF61E|nr:3-hydroxyacyl-CoA dehydrogenase [Methanobacteriaceae archaeon]MDD2643830.1 3-hydroxyacyl-CoA dehydrogenase [Methanobacteriaceae archaeon]MDD3408677.1 3-hydroxyacyl-CoA dehydrogenase [Methanobacteriaceae archaeon]MDD4594166.1 3-hydroxyacyl-CoA dehydrogenase [Methanobacteriaceae archaeon]